MMFIHRKEVIMNTKIDFIEGDTKRCLMAMFLPMLAAMALNMAYNLVDSLWIGNLLGQTAYAALTNATPLILLLTSVAMGMTNGVSILLSQAIGARDPEKAGRILATSLVLSLLLSAVVTGGSELLLRPLLTFLRTPQEVYRMADEYLKIDLLGYPAVYLYCYFTAVLRSYGDAVFQMAAMLVCTVLNAGLDPLLIHLFGFSGAAVATVLSQILCLIAMLSYLAKKRFFAFRLSAFQTEWIAPCFAKGVPAAFQQSIPAISTGFLTSLVSGYGITALAAYGIGGKLETILFYPAMAFNMVLTTIVGQCIGGGRSDRAKDYLKSSLLYGGGLLAVLSAVVVLFSRRLSGLFVDSGAAAEIVGGYFRIVGIGYVLNTVTNCFLGAVNGMGKPMKSMLCMVVYYLIVRMPLAWLFSRMGFGLNGIWSAVLVSHGVAAAAAAVICRLQAAAEEARPASNLRRTGHGGGELS
jgi:putative MATE family efflux protein